MPTIQRLKQLPTPIWGRGVTVAQQTFNLHGEGSNPSDLMANLVIEPSSIHEIHTKRQREAI